MAQNKCQIGAPLHSDFDPKAHVTTFGNSTFFNLAHALSQGALKDANIDTANMPIDRYRFGVSIGSMNASIAAATSGFPENSPTGLKAT